MSIIQNMRIIDKLIVHCSATREGQDIRFHTIKKWHVEDNNWSDIGYHYVIHLDGSIHAGRPIERIGAHTKRHNKSSIGICYVGGMDKTFTSSKDTRTIAQKKSLRILLLELKAAYPDAVVYGHRDFSNKDCPSFDAQEEYKWISDGYKHKPREKKEKII